MELSEQARQQVAQYQSMQQQLQLTVVQKQRLNVELSQVQRAEEELKTTKGKVYKNLGAILVETSKTTVKSDLDKTKEELSSRISTLQKHEEKLRKRVSELEAQIRQQLGPSQGGEGAVVEEAG